MNKKFIQQIRCLAILLFMSLSISPIRGYSQDGATVSLSLTNVELQVVMNEIEKQTRYAFVSPQSIDLTQKISVHVQECPLREALDQIFAATDIVYQIKTPSIFLSLKAPQSNVTVTGKVVDEKNQPVVGASVEVQGTNMGVSTDITGSFTIQVPPPQTASILKSVFSDITR